MKILVINPGSTSTKVAYYENEAIMKEQSVDHTTEANFSDKSAADQLLDRTEHIRQFLKDHEIAIEELDAVVARGGILPPVQAGAYEVNEEMIHYLLEVTEDKHASNFGAPIAHEIKKEAREDTLCLIYDSVAVDELDDMARLTGLKALEKILLATFLICGLSVLK